jgi:hypothetical protein
MIIDRGKITYILCPWLVGVTSSVVPHSVFSGCLASRQLCLSVRRHSTVALERPQGRLGIVRRRLRDLCSVMQNLFLSPQLQRSPKPLLFAR